MDRLKAKSLVTMLLSDGKLLKKLPHGRVDELADMYELLPDYFKAAAAARQFDFGGRQRDITYFAMNLVEHDGRGVTRKRRIRDSYEWLKERRERELKKLPAAMIDGMPHFRKSFIRELRNAGRDFVGDFLCDHGYKMPEDGHSTIEGAATDIASGYAYTNNWKPFDILWECAADYVHDGMQTEIEKIEKRSGRGKKAA
jgi:hypothetical protein